MLKISKLGKFLRTPNLYLSDSTQNTLHCFLDVCFPGVLTWKEPWRYPAPSSHDAERVFTPPF